ncbi:MAG TPA: ATP-binding protein [Usitatibacteraceae bacterium]|nr:ATP-binding protein [Usitatibacteraceae bacterium]
MSIPAEYPSRQKLIQRRVWWWLPALILALLLATTVFLLSLSTSHEASQNREQLITDTLWVKQSIQYQLERDAESLQLIANDVVQRPLDASATRLRLESYLRNVKEAARIELLGPGWMSRISALQEGVSHPALGEVLPADDVSKVNAMLLEPAEARRPFFGTVHDSAYGAALNAYALLPASDAASGSGAVAGNGATLIVVVFPFSRVLEQNVPWWFSQGHEITLMDALDNIRQTRAVAGPGLGVYTHTTALELPGVSLLLSTNSRTAAPSRVPNALRVSIAVLAGLLILSLYALWRDVKRRVRAEEKLVEEAAFRKAVGDSVVTGLRARDMDGRVTYVNPAFCKMVGLDESELVGKLPPMPYWAPEYLRDYEQRMAEVFAGTVSEHAFETVFQRADGTRFPVMIYEAPLKDAHGRQAGWMSSIVDVSEQKAAAQATRTQEERLQKVARLTTMGEIASSLAHELNQPLAAITSYLTGSLNLLRQGGVTPGEIQAPLEKANQQALRAGQVIRRVHDFVRKREPQRSPVSLHTLVHECLPLVELQARNSGVRVEADVAADLPQVMADPVLLEQVLLNLTRNAIESMAAMEPARRHLSIGARRLAGDTLQLDVRDYGAGIPEPLRDKLFSAFFTTKTEGMGMGLSICRSIIELHGGRLWFDSHADGTTFSIQLPCLADDLHR